MRIDDWLRQAQQVLEATGSGTARLDALVLLEDALNTNRAQLLAHPEQELTVVQRQVLTLWLARRARHEPLAYIRGKSEFYGREFIVSAAVLEPRPESETMVELLLKISSKQAQTLPESGQNEPATTHIRENDPKSHLTSNVIFERIADVGTGSGALGITAALELPATRVELLEIDPEAIKITEKNIHKYDLRLPLLKTDLLDGSSENYDALLCNLPYVPNDHKINRAAENEPKLAIFGGNDGLDLYRRLFHQIDNLTHKPALILTESLPTQQTDLAAIAAASGYHQTDQEDFIQAFELSG